MTTGRHGYMDDPRDRQHGYLEAILRSLPPTRGDLRWRWSLKINLVRVRDSNLYRFRAYPARSDAETFATSSRAEAFYYANQAISGVKRAYFIPQNQRVDRILIENGRAKRDGWS